MIVVSCSYGILLFFMRMDTNVTAQEQTVVSYFTSNKKPRLEVEGLGRPTTRVK